MDRVRYGPYKVEVDLCIPHGAWFDGGELARVAWHLRPPAAAAVRVAPSDRSVEESGCDPEDVADVVELLLDVLVDALD
jgi:Zn-finger nucleic acid-binding protein